MYLTCLRWLSITVGLLICGCAANSDNATSQDQTSSPDLIVPEPNPISVETAKMEGVGLGRTIVDLPQGMMVTKIMTGDTVLRTVALQQRELTLGNVSWAQAAAQELREAGYPFPSEDKLMFADGSELHFRYLVGGTVTRLFYVVHCTSSGYRDQYTPTECSANITWQVFDTTTGQVVHRFPEYGYAKTAGATVVTDICVRSAFRALLSEPDFVELIRKKSGSDPAVSDIPKSTITLNVPPTSQIDLPRQLPTLTSAVVTLKVNKGHGSGFFVTSDGYLLTAAHVVAGQTDCTVKLTDGTEFPAQVCRTDARADVALLKVTGHQFPALQLATEPRPPVGTEVYAIGTPLTEELDCTVSKGIVSAIRTIDGMQTIQTDASINGGNSGGPLIDSNGKVIGIVSQKVILAGFSGLGFAIPVDRAINQLSLHLTVTH
jgi:S1-C subfamily serine protease